MYLPVTHYVWEFIYQRLFKLRPGLRVSFLACESWAEPVRSFLAKTTMWMSDQPHTSAICSKSFIHWLTFGRSSPLNFSNESFTSSNVNTVHLGSSCLRRLTTGVTRTPPSWLVRSWFPGPLPSKRSPITPISSSSSSSSKSSSSSSSL